MHHLRGLRIRVPGGNQHLPLIVGLRERAVNIGKWGKRIRLQALPQRWRRNGNALGFATSERQKFIEKNELPYFDWTQEYCLSGGLHGRLRSRKGGRSLSGAGRVLCAPCSGFTFWRAAAYEKWPPAIRRAGWARSGGAQVAEANIATLRAAR